MEDRQNLENSKGYRSFRNALDLGMGSFYILIGVLVLYLKYFGTMELSTGYAYTLGSLAIVYGLFRIYRGIVSFRKINRKN